MIVSEQVYEDGHKGYTVQSDDGVVTNSFTKINVPLASDTALGNMSQEGVEALVPDVAPPEA